MVKPRVIETTEGIQGEFDVEMYDRMMRRMRNKGWLETGLILKAGIDKGTALEAGPGPGYFDGVFTNGQSRKGCSTRSIAS
jgi:hypothetical protein